MTFTLGQNIVKIEPYELERPQVRPSVLLNYLPAMYYGDDFLNRFLHIFEDTILPLQHMADTLHYYFHPLTCPSELVSFLSNWLALTLDENWSLEQRRNLIYNAVELYSWRGTRRGLTEYLKLYTDVEPEISEYSDGMILSSETRLGENTVIAGRGRSSFTVTMRLPALSETELIHKEEIIRKIIENEKPAHTTYRLRLIVDGQAYDDATKSYISGLKSVIFELPKIGADGATTNEASVSVHGDSSNGTAGNNITINGESNSDGKNGTATPKNNQTGSNN